MKKTKSKNQKAKSSVKPVSTPVPVAPRTFRESVKDALTWVDNNILSVLTGVLIVVIPLYPKLPLADLIEGYIVRARLEDILIAVTACIWLVQLLRRKVSIAKNKIALFIYAYLAVGVLSSLSAVFITHTVPFIHDHILKLGLHLFRRFEYFSLFFIAYSGTRTKKDVLLFVKTGLITLVLVVLYGFGQKYLYWPAFSTMNREFSKGMRLYLTPTSRVMSTFGGHYDYAAYLMMLLMLTVPTAWISKNKFLKIFLYIVSLGAYWSLILTASRTSFIGYLVGISLVAALLIKKYNWKFIGKRWVLTMMISMFIMLFFGDLSERFSQILESPSALHKFMPWVETGKIEENLYKFKSLTYSLNDIKNKIISPFKPAPPPNSISTDDLEKVAVSSDIPPSANKPLPPDVTPQEDLNRNNESTNSATPSAVTTGGGYSPNALKYGLSVAIRLDALWPRAIAGFEKNPLLGSGYSTLTKSTNEEFTQAESTDNDYLRMIGETGILGTVSFLGALAMVLIIGTKQYYQSHSLLNQIIYLGAIGSVIALLVNATYIDVFESSKVAYTLWILVAVMIRTAEMEQEHAAKA